MKQIFDSVIPGLGEFMVALVALALMLALAHFLYRKKIFLRL